MNHCAVKCQQESNYILLLMPVLFVKDIHTCVCNIHYVHNQRECNRVMTNPNIYKYGLL